MRITYLLSIVFLFFFKLIIAQADFRPGYVIEVSGDTLYGEIDNRSDLLMSTLCKFKDEKSTITKYSPNEIIGFRFIDGKYFVSKKIGKELLFLEYLIKGQVNIYYYRDKTEDHYCLEKEDVRLTELPFEEGDKYFDDKIIFYQSTKHLGILNYYMQDAPDLKERISSIEKPDHKNLIQLAEDYHNTVCDEEKCIIYEKKPPLFKLSVGAYAGILNYTNIDGLIDVNYTIGGIILEIGTPRTNERMHIRTGFLYSTFNTDTDNNVIYRIPFQAEYIYPKGIIRPKLALGLNVYNTVSKSSAPDIYLLTASGLSSALMAGLEVNLYKSAFLNICYDVDFFSRNFLPIIPQTLLSQSLTVGLSVKF